MSQQLAQPRLERNTAKCRNIKYVFPLERLEAIKDISLKCYDFIISFQVNIDFFSLYLELPHISQEKEGSTSD